MAAIISALARRKFGNGYLVVADVQMDNAYPTGGEPVTAQQFGLTVLDFVLPSPASGYLAEYDHTNNKLKAFNPRAAIASTLAVTTPALAHAAGATAVTSTAATVPDHAAGAACAIAGVAGVAAGPGAEVANGADLSAVTFRVIALGL
ncbi:MAG: hypothetical protein ACYC5Y_05235 [Symbiobacteriia bacterium]